MFFWHFHNILIDFVYFPYDLLLVDPLPLVWLYLFICFLKVFLSHYWPQLVEILVDIEIIAEGDGLYKILHGFTFDFFTFVDNETKKLSLDDWYILLMINLYFLTSAVLQLCFFDYLWYFIQPLICLFHDLIFYQFFIIPVLWRYLFIFAYLLRQGYIFKENRVILLTDLRTIIEPTIILLHIGPKIQKENDWNNGKRRTQIVHHHQLLLIHWCI